MRNWFLAGALLLAPLAQAGDPHIVVVGLMADRAIVKIDGRQVLLKVGDSSGAVQLVSVNAQEAVLSVGGRSQHFGLGMDVGGIAVPTSSSIDIPVNVHGEYLVDGFVNGHAVEFVVDTGANTVAMSAAQAKEMGIDYKSGTPGYSETAGGRVSSWSVMLDTVKVGPLVEHQVRASVIEAKLSTPVLLGMTFLSRVDLRQEKDRLHLSTR